MMKYNHEDIKVDNKNPIIIRVHHKTRHKPIIVEHWHRSIEINYAIKSDIDFWIDGVYKRVRKDEVVVINSGSIHRLIPDIKMPLDDGMQAITVIIPLKFFEKYNNDIKLIYFETEEDEHIDEVKSVLIKMAAAGSDEDDEYLNFKKISLTYELIYLLYRHYKKDKYTDKLDAASINIKLVHNIMDYITCNYKEELTMSKIAEEFSFSREHLSRVFKKYTGISLKEYIVKVRIDKSYEQLMNTDSTITQIASNNGFNDSKMFIRTFKKYFNSTPYQYRKISQNENN